MAYKKFTPVYLQEVIDFLNNLNPKTKEKVLYNIDKATYKNDPELFKKIDEIVWEFRTNYQNQKIRLFAFWDRRGDGDTIVIATHGIVKKKSKIDKSEIKKTKEIRKKYLGET